MIVTIFWVPRGTGIEEMLMFSLIHHLLHSQQWITISRKFPWHVYPSPCVQFSKNQKKLKNSRRKRAFTGNLSIFRLSGLILPALFFISMFLHRGGIAMPIIDWRLWGKEIQLLLFTKLLGESPVLSIHKVDLIVTLVSPCVYSSNLKRLCLVSYPVGFVVYVPCCCRLDHVIKYVHLVGHNVFYNLGQSVLGILSVCRVLPRLMAGPLPYPLGHYV